MQRDGKLVLVSWPRYIFTSLLTWPGDGGPTHQDLVLGISSFFVLVHKLKLTACSGSFRTPAGSGL